MLPSLYNAPMYVYSTNVYRAGVILFWISAQCYCVYKLVDCRGQLPMGQSLVFMCPYISVTYQLFCIHLLIIPIVQFTCTDGYKTAL